MNDGTRPGTHLATGATARSVAERAGVSLTTVSRVLNGRSAEISARTRERVLAIAGELGYRPNSLAAALRRGVTNTIGLLVPDISDAHFHMVARGAEDVARDNGYLVVFCNTDRVPERERDYVALLEGKRVDGVVFCGGGVGDEKHLEGLRESRIHVVTIGPHKLPFPSVRTDDAAAIQAAVNHLAEEGYQRILCIAGQPGWQISRVRMEGYRRGIRNAGLAAGPGLVVAGDFSQKSGFQAVRQTLAEGIDFDGVIAFNDYAAIGAMLALREAGRKVPADVAVVGCDDLVLASLTHPTLTSIGFPQYQFGRAAVRKILSMARGEPVERETTFPYRLVVRASSDRGGRQS